MPAMPKVEVERAGDVEVTPTAFGLLQDRASHEEYNDPDRDVDEHHPAPRHELGQRPAGHQADGTPGRRHRGEEPDRSHPLTTFREGRRQQRQRRRCRERCADALQGPGAEEHPARDGQAAEERAEGEDGDAGQEGAAAAEEVAGAGPEEEKATESEQVGVEDPRELAARKAQALLHVGQGDVDDRCVKDHHQLGGQDDEQEHRRPAEQALRVPGRPRSRAVGGRDTRRDNDRRRHLIPISPLVLL